MNLINEVLHYFLFKGVVAYLNDVLIYSQEYDQHILDNHLYIKLSKFHKMEVNFPGYHVSGIENGPNQNPGHFGIVPIADQVAATKFLKVCKLPP